MESLLIGDPNRDDDTGTPLLDDVDTNFSENQEADVSGPLSGSVTPTLDDNPPHLDTVAPARLDALTQQTSLATGISGHPEGDEEPNVDSRDNTPVEDENPEPMETRHRRLSDASNFSLVSNNSLLELQGDKNDDISSLSGLSSPEHPEKSPELNKSDLEDGEISASRNPRNKKKQRDADSKNHNGRHDRRSSSSGGYRRRSGGRRHRSGSYESSRHVVDRRDPSYDAYDDFGRRNRRSSGSKRTADLPRYDVRNVIERKRKKSKRESRSRSHSRSWSRSNSRERKRGKKGKKKRRSSRSMSPPPRKRLHSSRRSRSRSRTPPARRKNRRSHSRSHSPGYGRGRKSRYSRSPSFDDRYSGRKSSPVRRGKSPKKGKKSGLQSKKKLNKKRDKSPDVVEIGSKKKSKGNKKLGKTMSKKGNKSFLNGDSMTSTKTKKKRKNNEDNLNASSVITEKEVFASGDKIMVSVNFRKTNEKAKEVTSSSTVASSSAAAAAAAASAKPTVVIDVMSSPYQVIEPSPQEVIDVFSDDEEKQKTKKKTQQQQQQPTPISEISAPNGGLAPQQKASPSPLEIPVRVPNPESENKSQSKEVENDDQHKGPCTPPPLVDESLDLIRGPQTPTEDPLDSYDPCDPTESPEVDDADGNASFNGLLNDHPQQNGSQKTNGGSDSLLKSAATAIPFLLEDSQATNGDLGSAGKPPSAGGGGSDNDKLDFSVDMDMDSPFSPQSSELSDIFEPPLNTPLTNKKLATKRPPPQHKNSRQKSNSKHYRRTSQQQSITSIFQVKNHPKTNIFI